MTITPPAYLPLSVVSDDERHLVDAMLTKLARVNVANIEAEARYTGEWVSEQFGISIPPNMRNVHTVAGWCGSVVDVLEERLDWLGWTATNNDDFGLSEIYAENQLDVDSGLVHVDALTFGLGFVTVGRGEPGEPDVLITPHSPKSMTGIWDRRARRLSQALAVDTVDGKPVGVTLYEPNQTTTLEERSGMWVVVDRDQHRLGRLSVVLVPNRVRASREIGRSEITRAVRYYADAAARTLLGLEVNREFYNAPQRVGLNIRDEEFEDESGNPVSPWTAIQGRIWNVPPNEAGDAEPKIVQMDPASPAPYIDQVKGYAQLLAAEAGIPSAYLGFQTDNPSSADAIRAGEARLVKRAERRQSVFGRSWMEVGRLALMARDASVPDNFASEVSTRWRDAATPTRAAAADEAVKLTSGDNPILPPDSTVTYDRIGLTPAEQRQIIADKRRAQGSSVLDRLRDAASGDQPAG